MEVMIRVVMISVMTSCGRIPTFRREIIRNVGIFIISLHCCHVPEDRDLSLVLRIVDSRRHTAFMVFPVVN